MVTINIPRLIGLRGYQQEFWDAMMGGCRRAILVWHRRAGKDLTVLNWMIAAMLQRPGAYYYFFPTYAQAKKVLWTGQDKGGRPFLDNFPPELHDGQWEDELRLQLKIPGGGTSTFQLIGSDNMDSIVGTNPVGCAFSEYALMNPRAWDFVRPILVENGGWAVFDFTPRGKNHGHRLWTATAGDPDWFRSLKTVDDTRRDAPGEDGGPVTSLEAIEAERRSGMDESLIQQEFWVSFEGALHGAYYGDLLVRARAEGRIRPDLFDPTQPVDTGWDLGIDDVTSIAFTQRASTKNGPGLRWIDYYEAAGVGLEHFVDVIRQKPYRYGQHYAPHDIKVREWGTGNTRLQQAGRLGLHFRPVPKIHLADGIQAVRRVMPISEFDEQHAAKLVDILMAYRREFDDKAMTWKQNPLHDWASHGADAARYRATAYYELGGERQGSYQNPWSVYRYEEPREQYEDAGFDYSG